MEDKDINENRFRSGVLMIFLLLSIGVPITLLYLIYTSYGYKKYRIGLLTMILFISAFISSLSETLRFLFLDQQLSLLCAVVSMITMSLCLSIYTHLSAELYTGFVVLETPAFLISNYFLPVSTILLGFSGVLTSKGVLYYNQFWNTKLYIGLPGPFFTSWVIVHGYLILSALIYVFLVYKRATGKVKRFYLSMAISLITPATIYAIAGIIDPVLSIYKVGNHSIVALPFALITWVSLKKYGIPSFTYEPPGEVPGEIRFFKNFEDALSLFEGYRMSGYRCLIVSRRRFRGVSLWISKVNAYNAVSPQHLSRIKTILGDFVSEGGKVILIDCLELLILYNGIHEVLKFLGYLRDEASLNKALVLIPFEQDAFEPKTVSAIMRVSGGRA